MPLKRLLDGCRVVCDAGNGQMAVQASQWFHFMWRSIFTLDGEKTVFLQLQNTCGDNLLSWGWVKVVY